MPKKTSKRARVQEDRIIWGYSPFLKGCVKMTEDCFTTARMYGGFPIKAYFTDIHFKHGDEAQHQTKYVVGDRNVLKGGFVAGMDEIPAEAAETLCEGLYDRIKDWIVFNPKTGFAGIHRRGRMLEIYERK